jgi:phosphatidylinositol alpha-1,6-mannosyltransferase
VSAPWLAAVTLSDAGGGVAAVARSLADVLAERWGPQSRVVTLVDEASDATSLDSSTFARVRFGARLALGQTGGQCEWVLYSHLSLARVQRFVPALWRRPYAVFLHGIEVWRDLDAAQLTTLKHASLLIANSAYTARRVLERHAIGDVHVCPLALGREHSLRLSASPSTAARRDPVVLIVARMQSSERYKGHDELIDAWPLVLTRVPHARLVIAGGGDDLERLRAKVRDANLTASVEFTGFVSDDQLASLYEDAAVFAMPSRGEGFGLVYLEAMSHGVPCIGSRSDAATEVITDGETGYLVEQSDRGGLADRLVALLSDDARRDAMGAAARRDVTRRFTYDRFASDVLRSVDSTAPLQSTGLVGRVTA